MFYTCKFFPNPCMTTCSSFLASHYFARLINNNYYNDLLNYNKDWRFTLIIWTKKNGFSEYKD